jgi:hypothetical protein
MKKRILFILATIVTLSVTTGFIASQVTSPMKIRIHAKDLPEDGLVIIKPTDSEFNGMATALLGEDSRDELEVIKPLSVIIKNMGHRTVASHQIVWEAFRPDGSKNTFKLSYTNAEFFTDGVDAVEALARTNFDKTIKPGEARLISLIPLTNGPGGGGGIEFSGARSEEESHQGQDNTSTDSRSDVQRIASHILTRFTNLVVQIDGVFFDDGSFIGPNTTGFFESVKTQVDAKRDLVNAIAESSKRGISADEISKDLEAKANTRANNLLSDPTPANYYNFFTKLFATQFLQQKKSQGGDHMLRDALRSASTRQQLLHKIKG